MDTETQNCVTILEENWSHARNIDDLLRHRVRNFDSVF